MSRGLCQCGCGQATSLASTTRRGYKAGEPTNYIAGHQGRKSPRDFQVDEATGCWIWLRARNNLGYGQMTLDKKVVYAHRAFYEMFVGPIPDGNVIDHLCGEPSCVNPDHLEAVTSGENIRRGSRGLGSVRDRARKAAA